MCCIMARPMSTPRIISHTDSAHLIECKFLLTYWYECGGHSIIWISLMGGLLLVKTRWQYTNPIFRLTFWKVWLWGIFMKSLTGMFCCFFSILRFRFLMNGSFVSFGNPRSKDSYTCRIKPKSLTHHRNFSKWIHPCLLINWQNHSMNC